MCRTKLRLDCRLRERCRRAVRFRNGVIPFAVQLHELRAANEALPAERHDVRMCRAPAAQRVRPFLCAIDVEHVVTGADHAAVDDARDHRHDFAAGHGEHDFVQQRESLGSPIHPEKHARLRVTRERGDVDVSEMRPHVIGLLEEAERRGEITLDDLHVTLCAEQQAVFGALFAALVQQPLRAREPSVALGLLYGNADERVAEPERAARRAQRVTALDEGGVRTGTHVGGSGFVPDEIRRRGQTVQILGGERALPIGESELAIGLGPRLPIECRAAARHGIGCGHEF